MGNSLRPHSSLSHIPFAQHFVHGFSPALLVGSSMVIPINSQMTLRPSFLCGSSSIGEKGIVSCTTIFTYCI